MKGMALRPPTELIMTMRPGAPLSAGSAPSSGAKAWVMASTPVRIDLELALAELGHRQMQQRASDRDPGVVDQAEQGLAAERLAHLGRAGLDRRLVGDVEDHRNEIGPKFLGQPLGVGGLAHAAEHPKAAADQHLGGAPADAGGYPRDNHAFHCWPLLPVRVRLTRPELRR